MKRIKVELTLREEMLGTAPSDEKIYSKFILKKNEVAEAQAAEEIETLPEPIEETMTVFHKDEHGPFLYDYQIKGFFKDSCGCLRRVKSTESAKHAAFKKIIDGLIFVDPRRIYLRLPEGKSIYTVERPLRASTPMGERTCLAKSEAVPAGTKLVCEIELLDDKLEKTVLEWLDYGRRRGLGQWRNSGCGSFDWAKA